MLVPFIWRQMLRRKSDIPILFSMGLATTILLCVLHSAQQNVVQQMDAVYDRIPVVCTVTDLTGTRTDDLSLPEWVVNLFYNDVTTIGGQPLERSFSSYIEQVQAKVSLPGKLQKSRITLVGITNRSADQALWPDSGCEITWMEGYNENLFTLDENVCLISETMYDDLAQEENGMRQLTLTLVNEMDHRDTEIKEITLTAAGTYVGGNGEIYCPWSVADRLCVLVYGNRRADSISAVLRSNREQEDFWRSVGGEYFVAPDPSGERVEWEGSIYKYHPYALFINDITLRQTIAALERNRMILELMAKIILVVSMGTGFLACFLLIHRQERELALQRTLGVSNASMFFSVFMELLLITAVGAGVGAAGYFLFTSAQPVWGHIGLYIAMDGLGIAAASGCFLHRILTEAR